MKTTEQEQAAEKIRQEVNEKGTPKRLKIRTLLKMFGYKSRKESNTVFLTELLADKGIMVNPSLIKVGPEWEMSLDEMVTLVAYKNVPKEPVSDTLEGLIADNWFEMVATREFRNEKEVETKFVIPLLSRLGYLEDDRFDGMTFQASHGSKPMNLEVDCALSDNGNQVLGKQILLVTEAKRESKLNKETELVKARNQVKSYGFWLSCRFGLVTDSRKIQVLELFPLIHGKDILFECLRGELKDRFPELYRIVGKKYLVEYYERIISG